MSLKELSLENNPCCKDRETYVKSILLILPNLVMLDEKNPKHLELSKNDESGSENHEEVIELIKVQWEDEKSRIAEIENHNGSKKEYIRNTCITGGHAEIEDESILFIFGNSYDVVLNNAGFQEEVEKIRF